MWLEKQCRWISSWKLESIKKINEFVNQYDSLTCIDDMEIWKFADDWPKTMVRINPYPNDKGVKFHALYNIFYASSFQLANVMLYQPFPISCFNWSMEWNYVFFMDTRYTKCFNIFKEFHLINWDIGGDRDWSKQALK